MSNLYIGIMSGTSLDGIDIALCSIDNEQCKLISFEEYAFDEDLKADILDTIQTLTSLKKIGELDTKLGKLYADRLSLFIHTQNLDTTQIKAIGLHGQTLWHEPNGEFPFSMQLGNANIVSSVTGIKTVADFRRMDIANGGQGAPFAPLFHQFLFAKKEKDIAVVNIGGMANISILGKRLRGWDTGCGNVLLDTWISKTQGKRYDKDGEFAKSGKINEELLKNMLDDDYFKKLPPKSTGREYFNETWLANFLPIFNSIRDEDIQRTLLELTAQTIANEVELSNAQRVIVCGGGSKNLFLMQRLSALCRCKVVVSDTLGVDSDALEAMAFAWFAYKRINNEVLELKDITGAKENSISGGIYG